jgi:hypothetical protein
MRRSEKRDRDQHNEINEEMARFHRYVRIRESMAEKKEKQLLYALGQGVSQELAQGTAQAIEPSRSRHRVRNDWAHCFPA